MLFKPNKNIVLILTTITVLLLAIANIIIRVRASDNNLIIKLKIQGTNQTSNNKSATIKVYDQTNIIQENTNVDLIKQNDNSYLVTFPLNIVNFTDQYSIFIKPKYTIGQHICNRNLTQCQRPELFFQKGSNRLDITNTLFYVGDIDQNDIINEADSSLLLNYLGNRNTESIYYADLNSDAVVDSQDYALILYSLYQNKIDAHVNDNKISPTLTKVPLPPTPTSVATPTVTIITQPTITPTVLGICHAIKPDLSGGGAYDLESGSSSPCTCTLGVCAQAKCNNCLSGVCDCGNVPLQMPPTEMNCSNGATFTIQICTP